MRESKAVKVVKQHNKILKKQLDMAWIKIMVNEPRRKFLESLNQDKEKLENDLYHIKQKIDKGNIFLTPEEIDKNYQWWCYRGKFPQAEWDRLFGDKK